METEKQNSYYVVNQFQANVPFLHPLKTAETLLFFRCVVGVKKENIALNVQNTTSTSAGNNNIINGVTIFISEKFKGSCE